MLVFFVIMEQQHTGRGQQPGGGGHLQQRGIETKLKQYRDATPILIIQLLLVQEMYLMILSKPKTQNGLTSTSGWV